MFNLGVLRQFTQRAFAKPTVATAAIGQRLIGTDSKGPSSFGTGFGSSPQSTKDFARDLSGRISGGRMIVGRSVPVSAGGVGRAYARLNRILSDNHVREELQRRKRYEKPKYKRQRLRRESHARRFKADVRKKVHLVWKMKELGI
ncbi:hypothetical protein IWW50_004778 [Coemansia erecta]|nr:hypothetical protein IWW50_004778 [Coemansia erecta]